MYITRDSINKFVTQFMLSYDNVQLLTDETVYHGDFMITRDITSYLIPIFPKVLINIIQEYFVDRIDYTLRYPYFHGYDIRRIILSISSDDYQFNHDICCGIYDMSAHPSRIYIDTSLRILCPHKHVERSTGTELISFTNRHVHIRSNSYNNNIKSDSPLRNTKFDFGVLLDHIVNTKKPFWKRWFSKPIFVSKNAVTEYDSAIYNVSDIIMYITHSDGEVIVVSIINKHNLNMCIDIHKNIFDLLKNIQQTYCSLNSLLHGS